MASDRSPCRATLDRIHSDPSAILDPLRIA